jgi:hypothetical protein
MRGTACRQRCPANALLRGHLKRGGCIPLCSPISEAISIILKWRLRPGFLLLNCLRDAEAFDSQFCHNVQWGLRSNNRDDDSV